jgi:hypothetical protein
MSTPQLLAKSVTRMSAIGTKRTNALPAMMSAIGGKADVTRTDRYVG